MVQNRCVRSFARKCTVIRLFDIIALLDKESTVADLYKIKVNQKDLLAACENYLHHRHHKANEMRVQLIRELMSPSKRFFGLINVKPKFDNVCDCIRYMKSTPDDFYPGSIWKSFAFSGSKWTDAAQRLRSQLLTGKARGEVFLTDEMSFLLHYMK